MMNEKQINEIAEEIMSGAIAEQSALSDKSQKNARNCGARWLLVG